MKDRTLRVYLDGVPTGLVEQTPQGALGFSYHPDYESLDSPTPLSLSLPLKSRRHSNKAIRAFLDGLLPDNQAARERLARDYGVSPNNPFGLLRHIGRDAAGAVQILPSDAEASDASARTGDIEWLSDDDFGTLTRGLAENGADWDPGRHGGRWSLAGAQPKIALFRDPATAAWGIPRDSTPTTHIVKPAIEGLASHHVNETLCLRTARETGILATTIEVADVDGLQAVVVERYDRARDRTGRWGRIHQEDMCQALAVHPSLKYQSDGGPGVAEIGSLLSALREDDRDPTAKAFFKAFAFNILVGGTDAHAKNYSLILAGDLVRLAPLYDVASAAIYPQQERLRSAMKIGDTWRMPDVTDRDWTTTARRLGLTADIALETVEDLRSAIPDALARAVASLPTDVQPSASRMAEQIIK
ncbi:MAG: type II toxin-antitoxin system HipA family toxin, partial [Nocardioides sp.]